MKATEKTKQKMILRKTTRIKNKKIRPKKMKTKNRKMKKKKPMIKMIQRFNGTGRICMIFLMSKRKKVPALMTGRTRKMKSDKHMKIQKSLRKKSKSKLKR